MHTSKTPRRRKNTSQSHHRHITSGSTHRQHTSHRPTSKIKNNNISPIFANNTPEYRLTQKRHYYRNQQTSPADMLSIREGTTSSQSKSTPEEIKLWTPSTLRTIDSIHHTRIRITTGAFRTSLIVSLLCEAGEPYLYYRRKLLYVIWLFFFCQTGSLNLSSSAARSIGGKRANPL